MKTIGLRPSIYAFGMPVPSFIRWPLMGLAVLSLGISLVVPAVIIIPPIAVLAATIIGIALLALKYHLKNAPSQPHE